ncbi:hypothetical protein GWK47_027174 [Chionoecetes opilio]|uniref:Uncharacterized protein n=1 Tax=Chionoecetes opilio TaxID=41210 RepID=A0A8J8WCU1_CHIOP|nr:hypothetical protein GWK47_027174 [Chionoecetes opilio]
MAGMRASQPGNSPQNLIQSKDKLKGNAYPHLTECKTSQQWNARYVCDPDCDVPAKYILCISSTPYTWVPETKLEKHEYEDSNGRGLLRGSRSRCPSSPYIRPITNNIVD